MSTRKKRRITAEDLYRFELIRDARISPDGNYIVYNQQRVNKSNEKKYSNLWIVPTRGGRPQQFTYGDQVDALPRWSPDGKSIAFISNRNDEQQPQIHVIPFEGGEARPLTALNGEFGSLEWSPDGSKFLCQFRKKDADALARQQDEGKKKLGVITRNIERVFYKFDGYGFLPKERWHIWVIDARNGRGTQITDGEVHDEKFPAWSPDGKKIAYISNICDDPDLNYSFDDLFVISSKGGKARKYQAPTGQKLYPSFSPDGKWIAYLGSLGPGNWWRNDGVWIVPVNGSKPAKNLTDSYDIHANPITINDMGDPLPIPPTWSHDGERIFFQTSEKGNSPLRSITPDGKSLETVIDLQGVVSAFSLDAEDRKIGYLRGEMLDPCQIWVQDLITSHSRALTRVNRRLLNAIDLGTMEEIWFKGSSGNELQGWILKPPDFNPRKKYASILEIHGGPLVQYGNFFMHEFFYLAANDYIVYFSNPRGGQGYGEKHAKAIWKNWGSVDYEDLMAWSDYIAKQTYIDKTRMGVTGGSYGGYMTLWIIGHTKRYKAAVAQRVVSNFVSFLGTSDLNWVFEQVLGDKMPFEDLQKAWKHSPIKYIGQAETPTMLIHSEHDHRCPIEQGEQVFIALKKLGVNTEMIRFPEEPHGLSRMGRTDRRIERLKHILRWFDKYLT